MTGNSRYGSNVSEMNFRDLLQVLGRHKYLLAAHVVGGLLLAGMFSYNSPPRWEASSQIEIQGRTQGSPLVAADAWSQIVARESDFDILTEIAVLRFPDIYYETLNRLGKTTPINRRDFEENFPQVKIEQESTSKVVQITVNAKTREYAADFAETLPQVYKESVDRRNTERLDAGIKVTRTKVQATKARMKEVVAQLAEYRRKNQIAEASQEPFSRSQSERGAESDYIRALADQEAAQSRLSELRAALASLPPTKTDVVTESNRTQIEQEKTKLQDLNSARAALLTKYKPDNPKVKSLDASIEAQEKYITSLDKNTSNTITRPNPEVDAQKEKIRNAEAELVAAQSQASRYSEFLQQKTEEKKQIADTTEKQFALETELDTLKSTLQNQQTVLDNLTIRNNPDLDSPVTIRSQSSRSLAEQTAPKWSVNFVLGAGLGLLIGIFVSIVREMTLDKVNYPAEAVNLAGADILARIPVRARTRPPLIEDPQTARAFEAYRLLRAGMIMKLQQVGQGAFAVTSTIKGEGKTVVAGNLGVAMALDGRQTCVVDCNLRDPKLHKLFRVENEQGLTDILLNRFPSVEAACIETPVPNLRIITAGSKLANPTEALSSPEMVQLVEQLKTIFDVVIFDCPDAYSVADTQELTRIVRNVLFIVELGQTNRARMEQTLTFLRQASGRVLGLALNKDANARGRFS